MTTKLGKVFVVLITTLSLYLLGLAIAVVAIPSKWDARIAEVNKSINELRQEKVKYEERTLFQNARAEQAKKKLADLQTAYETQIKQLDTDATKVSRDIESARKSLAEVRVRTNELLEQTRETANQVDDAIDNLRAIRLQTREYDQQNQLLNDRIVNLRRQVEVVSKNEADLRRLSSASGSVVTAVNE
ncbi:hypothetical protein Isop_0019 [Isosphaera pallida ATCC 43644]|jgi:chromosome segregation ATPase|uniref:Uncharacterized protein n=1 Tax=Isosphaera pallida (strain ATCC 43644 / DSM 9630 / IS1B) TaxID=575540 RepID=E8R4M5_ISOPI|nr:hypothetical protein [Isosphaera pallida]ADV60616.1 hypothetical protein Isop_0019 [Isosphaera pallida ATCC 43644]